MPGSTRIKGAALALSFGGTDYWADHTSVKLENEEGNADTVTFADAAAGGSRKFYFTLAAIASTQVGSFWRYVWANTGATVAYRYAPHGNAVAEPDKPHFVGTVKIGPKPSMGGDAGADNEFTFEARLDCQEEPTLDDGGLGEPAISTIQPAGQTVGEAIVLTGTRFTGTTDVKFAAVSATSFAVVSDTEIVAVIPTGTGVKAITVINSDGTSAAVNYTVAAA